MVPQLRLGYIWMALPAALVVFTAWTMTAFPLDYWLHVLHGRWIAEHGALLSQDVFTHTITGREVLNYPWLAQWGMFQLHQLAGYTGSQFVSGLLYGLAIWITTWTAYRRCGDARIAATLGMAAGLVASTSLAVRPQAVSVLLFAMALHVLFVWRPGWRLAAALVAIEVVWTNSHGGFPLGVALPGAFLCGRIGEQLWIEKKSFAETCSDRGTRWMLATVALCGVAMFANPHGFATARYVVGVSSTASARGIGEWLPTSWEMLTGKALIASIVLTIFAAFGSRRRVRLVDLLLLAPLLIVAFKSQRLAIWWAMAAAPVMAPYLRSTVRRFFGRRAKDAPAGLNTIFALALLAFLLGSSPFTRAHNPLLPAAKRVDLQGDPTQALAFIEREQIQGGRVFHPLEWGCYFSWRLYPDWTVFVDTRIEAFPDDVWNDYTQAAFTGQLGVLDRYRVNLVVWDLSRRDALPDRLRESGQWAERYRDGTSVIFQRVNQLDDGSERARLTSAP